MIVETDALLDSRLDGDLHAKPIPPESRPIVPGVWRAVAADPAESDSLLAGLDHWLRRSALPIWWELGADHHGWGFHENLDARGRAAEPARRARVQARQAYVFARAGRLGWEGPWAPAVARALDALEVVFKRPDGLYRRLADTDGAPLDQTALLYDQAFVLLALSEAARVSPHASRHIARAEALRERLESFRWEAGGFRETAGHPFQANCHMHLFEACQAWLTVDGVDPAPWRRLAQEIADLATARFFDAEHGVLHEAFDSRWAVLEGKAGGWVEPGHQFEWAWLLSQWRRTEGGVDPALIRRLYDAGRAGFDPRSGCIVNRTTETFRVIDGDSRLWPQAEWLRAAVTMWRAEPDARYAADAALAESSIQRYLHTPLKGLWCDVLTREGLFRNQPAPASALYHLIGFLRPDAATAVRPSDSARAIASRAA